MPGTQFEGSSTTCIFYTCEYSAKFLIFNHSAFLYSWDNRVSFFIRPQCLCHLSFLKTSLKQMAHLKFFIFFKSLFKLFICFWPWRGQRSEPSVAVLCSFWKVWISQGCNYGKIHHEICVLSMEKCRYTNRPTHAYVFVETDEFSIFWSVNARWAYLDHWVGLRTPQREESYQEI